MTAETERTVKMIHTCAYRQRVCLDAPSPVGMERACNEVVVQMRTNRPSFRAFLRRVGLAS